MSGPKSLAAPASLAASVERFFQFSLLGLVASGYFALAGSGYLDQPTLVLTFLGLALRAAMVGGLARIEISARKLSLVALAYVTFFPVDLYFISRDFLSATVHGVCFLAVVKILTAESNRDYIYTGAISFIELIAAALLSARSSFFAFLALYVLFAIAAFTSAEIRRALQRDIRAVAPPAARVAWRLAVVAAAATAGILVVTAGLFLLVPRTARMAAMLFPNATRLTGFSNVVDLGGFGKISRDDSAVMHILSYARPLPRDLKWRGATLSRFDGKRWSEPILPARMINSSPGPAVIADQLQRSRRDGHRLLYRVDVQNADTGTLFIAGVPEFINVDAPKILQTPSEALLVPATGRERLRYEVSAHAGPPLALPLSSTERARYLQFPPLDLRIVTLARQWAGQGTAVEQAMRIQQHLQRDFKYKLDGPPSRVRDPLADFLFVRKEGYCEYFASSMAVMLRSLGIPSRVATGFQSGYFNNVSGLQVVRASDAHAWVEAWLDGRGWTTFDPTPSAQPAAGSALLARLDMYLDAADNTWQEWVVSYDLGHQVVLASRFEAALRGFNRPRTETSGSWKSGLFEAGRHWAGWLVGAILVLGGLLMFGPRLWREWRMKSQVRRILRKGATPSDAGILYEQMLARLARRGMHRNSSLTPLEFARALSAAEQRKVVQFTVLYNSIRFGGDVAATPQLAAMLKEFDAA